MGRPGSFLICLAIGVLLLSLLARNSYSQTGSIGAEINSTIDYVNMVNESAYLVFYPNLTASYNYIGSAENVSRTNPTYARALLGMAMGSAKQQLNAIDAYKSGSLFVLAIATIVVAVLLNRLMRPGKGKINRRQRRRRS